MCGMLARRLTPSFFQRRPGAPQLGGDHADLARLRGGVDLALKLAVSQFENPLQVVEVDPDAGRVQLLRQQHLGFLHVISKRKIYQPVYIGRLFHVL
jgi:hypothetical protein